MKFAAPEPARLPASKTRRWSTSGWMTPSLLGLLSFGLILGSYEHTQGNLHKLKDSVIQSPQVAPVSTGPGGEDPVVLQRHTNETGADPEFLSATLLPGRGFNLWQLTAYLPGHGEVPLLVSPPVAQANKVLTGSGADDNGSASTNFGAAFLAPWAAQLAGGPAPGTGILQTQWHGQRLTFPNVAPGSTLSTEGLLLDRGADEVKTKVLPDGESAEATFHAGTFSGDWPGNTDLTIQVELSGKSMVMTMTAQNTGTVAEPFGMGWHPYFAIPFGSRTDASLVIPSIDRISPPDPRTGLSSGNILPTQDTPYQFTRAGGTRLGDISLDETYVNLHSGLLADGPIAEFRDPAADYGLRITALSSRIKSLRVIAPVDKSWVSIGPNTNLPDPFGHEWDQMSSSGMVILQPGDSMQWKVRLEIFSISRSLESTLDQ